MHQRCLMGNPEDFSPAMRSHHSDFVLHTRPPAFNWFLSKKWVPNQDQIPSRDPLEQTTNTGHGRKTTRKNVYQLLSEMQPMGSDFRPMGSPRPCTNSYTKHRFSLFVFQHVCCHHATSDYTYSRMRLISFGITSTLRKVQNKWEEIKWRLGSCWRCINISYHAFSIIEWDSHFDLAVVGFSSVTSW